MPAATRTFRVFVSSTFEDMKEERDALQCEVFPKLRELCLAHGARFQAIDLRWGVRDEAALDQRTMEICLTEIERCQRTGIKPNFIVLLGDRYGWRPLAPKIEASEFEAVLGRLDPSDEELTDAWYRKDLNAVPPEYVLLPRTGEFTDPERWAPVERGLHQALRTAARAAGLASDALVKYEASATHQEILKGLGKTAQDREHVFAFFRSSGKTGEDPDLAELKAHLRRQLGGNAAEYGAGDLGRLCEQVRRDLEKAILSQIAGSDSRPPLEQEIEAHAAFAEDRVRCFTGRETELAAIADCIREDDRRPLVVHGASGSGKSALMARAAARAAEAQPASVVVRRFIGATPDSSAGVSLVRSACLEISKGYGSSEDAPVEYEALAKSFQARLAWATPERPLIVFLDALDQLADDDPAADLRWLPSELPQYARVIISTTEARGPLRNAAAVELAALPETDAEKALAWSLEEGHRTLQPEQHAGLLEKFRRCGLPLYLKLAVEQARRWRSFDSAEECRLGEGLSGIIDTVFDRLADEANHGPLVTGRSLAYLAAARYGLAEDEMIEVLSWDEEVWRDFLARAHHQPPERRLPVIVWSRLHLDLEPYLMERAAPGGRVITFYHRQMAERVAVRYLTGDERRRRHEALALHFITQPDWLDDERTIPNGRRAVEFVYQQVRAGVPDFACLALTDLQFIAAKCAAGLVPDLQQDYRNTIEALPEAGEEVRERSRREERIARHIHYLIACAAGELQCLDVPPPVELWDEERIAAEVERLATDSTRLERVRAFSAFVDAESHALALHGARPGFLVQQAHNFAGTGPVTIRAEASLEPADRTAMLLAVPHCRPPYNPLPATRHLLQSSGAAYSLKSVGVTPDGRRVVSGSLNGLVSVWDLETGRCLRDLPGHIYYALGVSVTPDGRLAVSASADKTLRVWDLERGECLRVLEGHGDEVTSVCLTPDGRRAISGSKDSMVRVWDVETGRCRRMLVGHWGVVTGVGMAADGLRAVSTGVDKTLRVWDLKTWQCRHVLQGHASLIHGVSMTPDGRRAASVSEDRTLRVWDPDSGSCIYTLAGPQHTGTSVCLTPDGRRAVTGSWDAKLRVWDLESGRLLRTLAGHSQLVSGVAMTADGGRAVSASDDGTLRAWDLEKGRNLPAGGGHGDWVTSVCVTAHGLRAISASKDHTLRVWDLEDVRYLRSLTGHGSPVTSVSAARSGLLAVSGSRGGGLRAWDVLSGQCLQVMEGHRASVESVSLTPDGRTAVSASDDGTLRVWDIERGRYLRALEGHRDCPTCVCVTPDGWRAVSGARDQTLRVWHLETGVCLRVLEGHGNWISSLCVSPDGRRAISGDIGGAIWFWDLESGTAIRTVTEHRGRICSLGMMPCGRRAVSASYDNTLRVWDLESGRCLALAHGDAPWTAVAASDTRLIAGTGTGRVVAFDLTGFLHGPA